MTQFERLEGIVSRITYKPGWKFRIANGQPASIHNFRLYDQIFLYVQWKTEDVTNHDKDIPLSFTQDLRDIELKRMTDKEIVKHIIGGVIRSAELHEMDEWFKVDGVCVCDPHPEIGQKV